MDGESMSRGTKGGDPLAPSNQLANAGVV
ncbi:hypothetical protein OOU_Y34scaffold00207g36 [Pyricularia oryzae Y34]|uniref:Uncharacterized protein n=2 Tax=Pyricularia oryzae TaxID=318829 RepID=A0AA97P5K1_PYRO3|nr:hypothetical protein OOU_Y34scaffold00207g36 [Pyricularia oryzae Y34]